MVLFRDARRDEVPQVIALLADDVLGAGREDPGGEAAYLRAFDEIAADPHTRLIVAELDGQVVGTLLFTVLLGLSRHGMRRVQLEAVRVAAGQRGRGLGRQLLGWAVDAARAQGCGLVQLTSDKRRGDSIRFYESVGFTASHEGFKLYL